MSRPRVRVPAAARAGEEIEIRTLIDHPMETGLRRDASGRTPPRDMLRRFEARADGEVVFAADFANGTAANPAITFRVRVERTTRFEFSWHDEAGGAIRTEATVRVG
jgi:sulfur-oxidizing protein SoxZ